MELDRLSGEGGILVVVTVEDSDWESIQLGYRRRVGLIPCWKECRMVFDPTMILQNRDHAITIYDLSLIKTLSHRIHLERHRIYLI